MTANTERALRTAGTCFVAAAAIGVAAYQFSGSSDDLTDVPDLAELRSAYACQNCGEVYRLTPRQRMTMQMPSAKPVVKPVQANSKTARIDPTSDDNATSIREVILHCRKCGQSAVRKALTCPKCHNTYASPQGDSPACPQCGIKPAPTRRSAPRPAPRQRPNP